MKIDKAELSQKIKKVKNIVPVKHTRQKYRVYWYKMAI